MFPIKIHATQANVNVVRFNYDGDLLFSGNREKDTGVNVFNSFTGELLGTYKTKVSVKSIDIDLDSKILVYVSFDGTLQMFEVETGNSLKWVNFPSYKFYHVEFDLSSKKLMLVYGEPQSSILVLDYESLLKAKPDISGRDDPQQIRSEAVTKISDFPVCYDKSVICKTEKAKWFVDNKTIFMGTKKGEILQYSETGQRLNQAVIHKDATIQSIDFSKNYEILATAARDGCKIIDPINLQVLRFFKQEYKMNDVSISPLFSHPSSPKFHVVMAGGLDPKYAAESKHSGFEVHLCNVMDGTEIGKLSTNFSPVNSIQFHKDGKGYVTGSEDSNVVIVRFDDSYFENPKYA